jgi:hypothetical protein
MLQNCMACAVDADCLPAVEQPLYCARSCYSLTISVTFVLKGNVFDCMLRISAVLSAAV